MPTSCIFTWKKNFAAKRRRRAVTPTLLYDRRNKRHLAWVPLNPILRVYQHNMIRSSLFSYWPLLASSSRDNRPNRGHSSRRMDLLCFQPRFYCDFQVTKSTFRNSPLVSFFMYVAFSSRSLRKLTFGTKIDFPRTKKKKYCGSGNVVNYHLIRPEKMDFNVGNHEKETYFEIQLCV